MKYTALLRGIGPGNPNMANERLRETAAGTGLQNVRSIISSGNLVFESSEKDTAKLAAQLEAAWQEKLGFASMTIVKEVSELERLIAHDPFAGLTHSESSYLLATFFKRQVELPFELPHQPTGKPYTIVGFYDNVLFSVTDNTTIKTSDLMVWLEKQFTKDITSRTWKTVERIYAKLQA